MQAHNTERQAKLKLCAELHCTPKHLRKAHKLAKRQQARIGLTQTANKIKDMVTNA